MESIEATKKQHALCIPFPAQGHINPMLKFAILLHNKGFHITFVHTEYNYTRLLRSQGPAAVGGLLDFRFETIPDGLSPADGRADSRNLPSLCFSTRKNCLAPVSELIKKLNHREPPVSCVIADSIMSFALDAAEEIGVPGVMLRTASACSFLCYKHVGHLVDKGFVPLKDEKEYLDTPINWIPGMIPLRLKDFPSFVLTTDPKDEMLNYVITETARSSKASAIIINTVFALEKNVLNALSSICPPIYTIGPLQLLIDRVPDDDTMKRMSSSLLPEEPECLEWLDSKPKNSVIYVNYGSIAVLTPRQVTELAWGLMDSNKSFLWIVRPDLVSGENTALPLGFSEAAKDRGFLASWCPQEKVLAHGAVGGFLTHCGWNSMTESLCSGVPMLCWPFFADQQINCRYACDEWGVGLEICSDAKREDVGYLVRELLDGERGEKMKRRALEWKEKVAKAIDCGGSSYLNLSKLVKDVLCV
ncbi:7-deoxyloganetin glucosyltransferase-like [Primulina huaijiensis]|uniref:7-deoxyloganetin glucosyltransferase-like n=1 Tax=Primulina huaijiensis TaxID=1492673 RepID=UPI003CC76450